ncbi:MAG: hypothetical protein QOJ51_4730 [Acidobacteriaceae bacterium]|nr:hypothetical protein [Acidobacteriaceae bacterium]
MVTVLVTGAFSNPKFAPDVQQIAEMKGQGPLPIFLATPHRLRDTSGPTREQKPPRGVRNHRDRSSPNSRSNFSD